MSRLQVDGGGVVSGVRKPGDLRVARFVEDGRWLLLSDGLVVIDPEDAEQVERLIAEYLRDYDGTHTVPHSDEITSMMVALRRFANPTPPKPEEPRTLFSQVEDADGAILVSERRAEQRLAQGVSRRP